MVPKLLWRSLWLDWGLIVSPVVLLQFGLWLWLHGSVLLALFDLKVHCYCHAVPLVDLIRDSLVNADIQQLTIQALFKEVDQ